MPTHNITLATRINVAEFKARHEGEARARRLFYEDLDAGLMPHLVREFTKAPWHIQEFYRSLARRTEATPVSAPPSFAARVLAAGRRFIGGLA